MTVVYIVSYARVGVFINPDRRYDRTTGCGRQADPPPGSKKFRSAAECAAGEACHSVRHPYRPDHQPAGARQPPTRPRIRQAQSTIPCFYECPCEGAIIPHILPHGSLYLISPPVLAVMEMVSHFNYQHYSITFSDIIVLQHFLLSPKYWYLRISFHVRRSLIVSCAVVLHFDTASNLVFTIRLSSYSYDLITRCDAHVLDGMSVDFIS